MSPSKMDLPLADSSRSLIRQGNPAVGLVEALKALVRVQDMMQAIGWRIGPISPVLDGCSLLGNYPQIFDRKSTAIELNWWFINMGFTIKYSFMDKGVHTKYFPNIAGERTNQEFVVVVFFGDLWGYMV